jgi:hypothetical protein
MKVLNLVSTANNAAAQGLSQRGFLRACQGHAAKPPVIYDMNHLTSHLKFVHYQIEPHVLESNMALIKTCTDAGPEVCCGCTRAVKDSAVLQCGDRDLQSMFETLLQAEQTKHTNARGHLVNNHHQRPANSVSCGRFACRSSPLQLALHICCRLLVVLPDDGGVIL